ncbi:hypothetical protein QUF72_01475 [Desulfobacterales bacterium HSG2]|nr:hypothetical protein [Desulfobacterales bacterium HSG2]
MPYSITLMRKLEMLDPELKEIQWAILEEIEQHREESVTKNEFNELKDIVRELGQTTKGLARSQGELVEAQKRTEQRVEGLAKAQGELVEAQKRTEQRMEGLTKAQERTEVKMEELAEAQKRTEQRVEGLTKAQERTEVKMEGLAKAQERTELRMGELAEAQKQTEKELAQLSRSQRGTRGQVGGLSKSMAYALENEAFRHLPGYLEAHRQLKIRERFVRTFVRGEEINMFAKAERNGEDVLVVGEAVLRLDDRSKMAQLEKNTEAVKEEFGQPVVPLIITHFAHPDILWKASEQGVLVVQSFEWG